MPDNNKAKAAEITEMCGRFVFLKLEADQISKKMERLQEKLDANVKERISIENACKEAGHFRVSVSLLGVDKTFTVEKDTSGYGVRVLINSNCTYIKPPDPDKI